MASSLLRRSLRLHQSLLAPVLSGTCCQSSRHFSLISSYAPILRGVASTVRQKPSLFPSQKFFASRPGSDEALKKVLEEEIKDAESEEEPSTDTLPKGFPFEIVDNPEDESITLKRKYMDETIEASVFLNVDEGDDVEGEEGKNQSDDDDAKGSAVSNISLVVTIDKGMDHILEFSCTANPEEMVIDEIAMRSQSHPDGENLYDGPPFWDLNENLQNELHKYLEARGINASLFEFLQDYMLQKDERNYLTWLKNMKEFIEA